MSNDVYGTLKSGIGFYIGDICYVLGEKVYDDFWGKQKDYEDDLYDDVLGSGFGFAVCGTGIGDGTYRDESGHEYPVDAGVIGAVPLELIKMFADADSSVMENGELDFEALNDYGRVVLCDTLEIDAEYDNEGSAFAFTCRKGRVTIDYVDINCRDDEDEYEDYEEEYDEEEEDDEDEEDDDE